jgi:tripartite-type tricarboxylate transporter receptor subunit TctC
MQAFEFLCCRVVLVALTICVACGPAPTRAQPYPNRPITLIVPLPPGGSNDIMARAVADKLSASLGQQVVVENRAAGGSGTVGTRQAAKSAADGYTLLLGYTSTLATGPSMHRDVGYDPRKDFAPIGLIAAAPSLLLLHPDLKIRSVSELIAMMKSADPPFQVGVPGIGTVNHLASVLFAHQAGVKVQQIPYKGSNALITDLAGGHVKVGFNPIPVSRAALESKLIVALAATSLRRSTALPDVSDRCRVGTARVRCGLELWPARARRHAAAHHRHSQQRPARGARNRGGQAAAAAGRRRADAHNARGACGRHRSRGDQMVYAHPLRRLQGRVGIARP